MSVDGDSMCKSVSKHTNVLFFLCLLHLQRLVPCSGKIMGVFADKKSSRTFRLYFSDCKGRRGWPTRRQDNKNLKNIMVVVLTYSNWKDL